MLILMFSKVTGFLNGFLLQCVQRKSNEFKAILTQAIFVLAFQGFISALVAPCREKLCPRSRMHGPRPTASVRRTCIQDPGPGFSLYGPPSR